MVVRGGEIGTVCRMFQHRETQFHKSLKSVGGSMWVRVACNNRTPDDNRPRCLVQIAGFSSALSISLYPTLSSVVPLSR